MAFTVVFASIVGGLVRGVADREMVDGRLPSNAITLLLCVQRSNVKIAYIFCIIYCIS